MRLVLAIAVLLLAGTVAGAQTPPPYDLLLKGGHVLDPKNNINGPMDVAIAGGKVARVAADIPAAQARKTVNAGGFYVTPGLIDIHVHFYAVASHWGLIPDPASFPSGVTTAVDAGTSGYKNFEDFYEKLIRPAKTRVLAFLNIVSTGMTNDDNEQNPDEMRVEPTVEMMRKHPDVIVGVKTAHYWTTKPFDAKHTPWVAVDRAREAAAKAGKPMMVDFAGRDGRSYRDLLLEHMRPGDIHTHVLGKGFDPVVDYDTGKVYDYMFEARKRGVIFDLGHGSGSFWFRTAVPALKQGFVPDSISTDLHMHSVNGPAISMINVMSKMLNLGLSLEDVIRRSTVNPAREIGHPELGTLSVGADADLALIEVQKGSFGFWDCGKGKIIGNQKLDAVMTIRAGEIVWDRDGRSMSDWKTLPKLY